MVNLFLRNLGIASVVTIVWLLIALPAKAAGGFTLLGGFWVFVFGFVCWETAVSVRNAIDKGERRYITNQLHLRIASLILGVLAAQAILLTLEVSYVEGKDIAGRAFFRFLGIAGSTSLLVPVCFWSRPKAWLPSVVAVLIFAGLYVWWEVVRNLWPDELFLGPAIGLGTIVLSTLLLRWPLKMPVPNSTTRKAMDELEQGKGKRFDSADELFEDLGV